jgi:ankyrin repeat protein
MDLEAIALNQQLQDVVLDAGPDFDLDLEGLQLLDPPEAMPVPDGHASLHAAAEAGWLEEVQQLLAAGADVNARSRGGETPLHRAARGDHGAVAAALLAAGADPHARNARGRNPLHVAAAWGSKDIMQQLLACGAEVKAFDVQGHQPLHLSCMRGMAGATRLLLAHGAPVNQPRAGRTIQLPSGTPHYAHSDGFTPLHAACDRSEVEVVRALLAAGAGVNTRCRQGYTPLWLASKRGRLHVIEELLGHGADSSSLDMHGGAPLHIAIQNNCIRAVRRLLQLPEVVAGINAPTSCGATPLCLAAGSGFSEVVSLLVAAGADVNRPALYGQTPLYAAINNRHTGVVQQLLAAGASINCKAANGETLLHTAMHCGMLADVQQLLAWGADPGAVDARGLNSLQAAAAAGHVSTLEVLVQAVAAGQGTAGMDDAAHGMTALHWAVEHQQWACVEVLLAAGADASKLYGEGAVTYGRVHLTGATALHRAVQLGGGTVVPLLATPANLYHLWNGMAPLHLALVLFRVGRYQCTKQVMVSMLQALLAAGAPPGLPDWAGVTPLQMAADSDKDELRGLVPAMVRTVCMLYKQQQEEGAQGLGGPLQDPMADVAGVVRGVFRTGRIARCVSCISAVMDVLGLAAPSRLLRQLLQEEGVMGDASMAERGVQLVELIHSRWSITMQPLQSRQQLASRLQQLVVQPLLQQVHGQQHLEEGGRTLAAMAAGQRAPSAVFNQGRSAAQNGKWGLVMQCMEQLAATPPPRPPLRHYKASRLFVVAKDSCSGSLPQLAGLCEALLAAWYQAQHKAAAQVQSDVVEAVVAGVQAWQQLEQQAAPVGGNSRRRLG